MFCGCWPRTKLVVLIILLTTAHLVNAEEESTTNATCACGELRHDQARVVRIVGGHEAKPFNYPWMVTLALKNGKYYIVHCGATIISSTFILTAAHCAQNMDLLFGLVKMTLMANVNDHDISTTMDAENDMIAIKRKIPHPSFNATTLENDIALLEIDRAVQLMPACLLDLDDDNLSLEGKSLIVTGWGDLKKNGYKSDTLQEITVPVLPQSICRGIFAQKVAIKDYQFCAGYLDGSRDACQGDSGGPATYNCDEYLHVVGIISYGLGCAKKGYPGVYAYVPHYNDWIRANTLDDPPCFRPCRH